jgi:dCMP deaminase
MKHKFKIAFMKTAYTFSELSSATKLQVGAVVVKDDRIISLGYNGTPTGWDNVCERVIYPVKHYGDYDCDPEEFVVNFPYTDDNDEPYALKTKPEVIHAEMNALMKLASSSESGKGASIFITHAPCIDCAKGIYQTGITEVYYRTQYRNTAGIEFLEKCGIVVEQLEFTID